VPRETYKAQQEPPKTEHLTTVQQTATWQDTDPEPRC
jgi:hypothetical protein